MTWHKKIADDACVPKCPLGTISVWQLFCVVAIVSVVCWRVVAGELRASEFEKKLEEHSIALGKMDLILQITLRMESKIDAHLKEGRTP